MENFEDWVNEVRFRIMRPNTMNKYGAVLDDFGLETMLDKLMEGFVRPISKGRSVLLYLLEHSGVYNLLREQYHFVQYSLLKLVDPPLILIMALLSSMVKIGMLT